MREKTSNLKPKGAVFEVDGLQDWYLTAHWPKMIVVSGKRFGKRRSCEHARFLKENPSSVEITKHTLGLMDSQVSEAHTLSNLH